MQAENKKGGMELETIVKIVILFLAMLLIIIWATGGFKTLTGGISNIGNASMARAINVSNSYPG